MLYFTGLPYFVTAKKMLYVTGLPYFAKSEEDVVRHWIALFCHNQEDVVCHWIALFRHRRRVDFLSLVSLQGLATSCEAATWLQPSSSPSSFVMLRTRSCLCGSVYGDHQR